MKSLITFLIIISVFSVLFCSDKITGPTLPNDVPLENLVAFKAEYTGGDPYMTKIVLMDFYNRNNFRVIYTDSVFVYDETKFSPDKSVLLTNGRSSNELIDSPYPLLYYSIENNTFSKVAGFNIPSGEYNYPRVGLPLWFDDNSGFFFNFFSKLGLIESSDFYYYSLDERHFLHIDYSGEIQIYPIGIKDDGRIICLYYKDDKYNLCLFNMLNNETEYIENDILSEKLKYIEYNGRTIEWNNNVDMFVFTEIDIMHRSKISVINIDGSFYKSYTNGEYLDIQPVWGPNGQKIIFQRHINDVNMGNPTYEFMLIDLISEGISTFLKPVDIDARRIFSIDY